MSESSSINSNDNSFEMMDESMKMEPLTSIQRRPDSGKCQVTDKHFDRFDTLKINEKCIRITNSTITNRKFTEWITAKEYTIIIRTTGKIRNGNYGRKYNFIKLNA